MKISALVLTCAIGLCAAAPTEAATIRVPADAATIQQAIDAAVPGDTVLVAPGTGAFITNILSSDATSNRDALYYRLRVTP